MDLKQKLEILSEAARYDVSCSSSGSRAGQGRAKNIGNTAVGGICHSFTADGRCVSLLKILMTNHCAYDCVYCANRRSNDFARATLSPEEVCQITLEFYRRNYIEGLFLSSGVLQDPDSTMERLLETARLLRGRYGFGGYLHLKAIPGADPLLVRQAAGFADRMSCNIELPGADSLRTLAPQKSYEAIFSPLQVLSKARLQSAIDPKLPVPQSFSVSKRPMLPAGLSTQMIVGASPEADGQILRLSEKLYQSFGLKRVYYSAYFPVNQDKRLPALTEAPLLREHRLYQADWLLRFYGFSAQELLGYRQNFDLSLDPKASWALHHLKSFPIEVNQASYRQLLKVPGIGPASAKRIVEGRRFGRLSFEDLRKMGVVLKRAQFFLLCQGRLYAELSFSEPYIKRMLARPSSQLNTSKYNPQLSFLGNFQEAAR